jgi:DNA methylase
MKPVELVERAIRKSSKARDIALDPFGGSGTTLIACEKAGPSARLIELAPDGSSRITTSTRRGSASRTRSTRYPRRPSWPSGRAPGLARSAASTSGSIRSRRSCGRARRSTPTRASKFKSRSPLSVCGTGFVSQAAVHGVSFGRGSRRGLRAQPAYCCVERGESATRRGGSEAALPAGSYPAPPDSANSQSP